jgi:alpha-1,2-mannosyltransferase
VAICLMWYAMKQKLRPVWIAIPLAIGILLKLYPILFLALPLIRKDFKTVALVGLILLGAAFLAQWVLPSGIWQDWYTHVASSGYDQTVRGLTVASTGNQSINAFFARLFFGRGRIEALVPAPDWVSTIVPYLASGLVLLITLAVTYLGSHKASEDVVLDLQFSLWLLAMFLVAPLSWDHLLVLLLPSIYVALKWAVTRRSVAWFLLLGALSALIAWSYPYDDPAFQHGLLTLLISAKFFAVLSLWLFFVVLNLTASRAADASVADYHPAALRPIVQNGSDL